MSTKDALAVSLIQQMRAQFGEAAKDTAAMDIISEEVNQFMDRTEPATDQALNSLKDCISSRLTGRAPQRNTLLADHTAKVQSDEWARIWAYECERVNREVVRDKEIEMQKKLRQRNILDQQIQERLRAEQMEKEEDMKLAEATMKDVEAWKVEEAARKKAAMQKMMKFKELQEKQVAEKAARLQQATEARAAEEAEMAARIAWEVKDELEKEERGRREAKEGLVTFLKGNEANKVLREEQKRKQMEEDIRYMQQYEEMLDKQEQERQQRLAKLQEWQNKQEIKAKHMPESKKWIDPGIIEKNWRLKEAELDAHEENCKRAQKQKAQQMVQALNQQIAEKAAISEAIQKTEQQQSQQYLSTAKEGVQRDLRERRKRAEMKLKAKQELEQQMRENAERRRAAPMSKTEKLVNAPLLRSVSKFEKTQTLPLKPYPAEFLPKDLHKKQAEINALYESQRTGRLRAA